MFSLARHILSYTILICTIYNDVVTTQLLFHKYKILYSRKVDNAKTTVSYEGVRDSGANTVRIRNIEVEMPFKQETSSFAEISEGGYGEDEIIQRPKRDTKKTNTTERVISAVDSNSLKFVDGDEQDINQTIVNSNISLRINSTDPETYTPAAKSGMVSVINTGLISKTTYDKLERTVRYMTYVTQIIAVVLVCFNIIVFSRHTMRSPTSSYLIAVNISQIFTIVSGSFLTIAGFIFGDKAFFSYNYLFIGLYISNYFTVATRRCTFVLTCLVAAERFLAVAFPLKSKHFKLVRKPILFIVTIAVLSFIFHIFSVLKYDIIPFQVGISNETFWKFQFTKRFLENKANMESWSIASKIIFVYIQLIGCLILNIGIVIALKRHRMNRLRLNSSEDVSKVAQEKQTTVTILVSTFVFVLLALPVNTSSVVANLNRINYGINTKNHYLFYFLMHIGGWFELLSDCTNFMFYIALSSRFRKTFAQVICRCFSTPLERTESIDYNSTRTCQYGLSVVSQSSH
ncbi:hypothetical protein LOTGIDRAFT_158519 [Lottia gigantea]|uniref:G-protein coupled receptors family 1 profile domain-containing protein n=1 Tax=Lottia gigantea TaxID=225164 RepID=V4CC38_LOTGI|nr:hypothetical protein LOTGIDRAFT_158519 [Lottia gigantea]ESO99434.1 hypothetical protein LOTGIDRAFT_158519 [Lottia gigantea]